MSNIHPLEVVGRGGETQLQVGENLDKIINKKVIKVIIFFHKWK